ncbi:hypothetical protein HID58_060877, partial [Brassica napus]
MLRIPLIDVFFFSSPPLYSGSRERFPVNLSLAVDGQATPSTLSLLFNCSWSSDLNVQTLAFRHREVRQQIDWVIHDNSSLDPDLIRSSSLFSPLSVLSSSHVCPLLNRGSAYLHQPSPSPSGFDGNPAYLSKLVSPPASAIYLSVDVIRTISDLQPRSMTSRNFPVYAFASELRSIPKWAWPNSFAEAYNQIIKILKARLSVLDVRYLAAGLNSLDNLKISHGFIGVYNLILLQYHFFRKNLSSSSSNEESISPPYLPSMNGDITSVLLVGGGCPSTSLVTISQLSDFVVKALQTHSSIVLSVLSFSYEDLSCLISFLLV